MKDVQYQVEKPDEKKQVKLNAFLTKEEKEQSKVSEQTTKGPQKRKIDPVGGIRKENINTVKAKKTDTEQSTDKRGSPVCEKSEVNSNDLGLYVSNASSLSDPEKYSLIKNV